VSDDGEIIDTIAEIIDPEAFGLPVPPGHFDFSDRDLAREKARQILADFKAALSIQLRAWEDRLTDR